MDRRQILYWGLGTAGLFLVNYFRSKRPQDAVADTLGDLGPMLPRSTNPVLRAATQRIMDMTENACRRQRTPPAKCEVPGPHIVDAEFTVIEDDEKGPV